MARTARPRGTDSLDALIRAVGGRSTRQRRAIYSSLAARCDHPTAENLYREVLRRVRGLSRATVYTTLHLLLRAGAASRIVHADGVAHFDARTDPHDHSRCVRCGRIDDVDVARRPEIVPEIPGDGFSVTGYRLEYLGHCAACDAAGGARSEP